MVVKTPLRYPGGKSRALKTLLPIIPKQFSEYREPFMGGCSVFLAVKQHNTNKKYWLNDLNTSLHNFWRTLRDAPSLLIHEIQQIKNNEKDGRTLYAKLVSETPLTSFDDAVRFFVLNRITFSGVTECGGYSQEAFEKRFTQSSIDRLVSVAPLLIETNITNVDYEAVVNAEGDSVFLFLDPPYLSAEKSKPYGKKGSLHTNFDHERFAGVVKDCKHRWMITYDDCPKIRELFDFASIIDWRLQYGMNNFGQTSADIGHELLITNYGEDVPCLKS
jgi:DNA adenine methylase